MSPGSGRRAAVRLGAVAAAISLAACIEISSPTDAIESLSAVNAAFPAVVAGDTLRDSTGAARRLQVVAFTGRGDTVASPDGLQFFLPDSGTGARIENGFLVAGARLGPVRIVAQVPGLQTPPVTVEVTVAPTSAAAASATTLPQTTYGNESPTVTSPPLNVRVRGTHADTAADVNGWIVRYVITRQPASPAGLRPAYLTQPARGDSSVSADTTASGLASRSVVLRPALLSNRTDTVVVEATVTYRGAAVPGSPIVFRVPFAPRP